MFTGIITHFGTILKIENFTTIKKITLKIEGAEIQVGDSVSCDGICLTAQHVYDDEYVFDVSLETQSITNIKNWYCGYICNIELAMLPNTRLGGHFVTGHIDGTAQVVKAECQDGTMQLGIECGPNIEPKWVLKGSLAINGVSLTINQIIDNKAYLTIIPHTFSKTNLNHLMVGKFVNIEFDMICKMVYEQTLLFREQSNAKP